MLNSDAPQPIKDRIYIPQEHSRKISHSEEAHDEGGGFSFVFHEKGGKNPGEKQENEEDQTPATEIGDAVEVHISGKAASDQNTVEGISEPETSNDQNPQKKPDDDDGQERKHINITV